MNQQIKITIDKVGRPTIEAIGFVGGSCKDATKQLEDLFVSGAANGDGMSVVNKPEMYMVDTESEQNEVVW